MTLMNAPATLSYTWQMQFANSGSAGMQMLEGLWWRHDDGVEGFLSVSNSTSQDKETTLQMFGPHGRKLDAQPLWVPAHSTKMVDLAAMMADDAGEEWRAGGIRVEFEGRLADINVAGGLVNWNEGYSAVMPFWMSMMGSDTAMPASLQTLSNVGLMIGAPGPMMNFPAGTIFTPYLITAR